MNKSNLRKRVLKFITPLAGAILFAFALPAQTASAQQTTSKMKKSVPPPPPPAPPGPVKMVKPLPPPPPPPALPKAALYIIDGNKATRKEVDKIPEDQIESVMVWKGKEAVEKYGKKGKKGVVVVTTKK